jgi:hypothetical protein
MFDDVIQWFYHLPRDDLLSICHLNIILSAAGISSVNCGYYEGMDRGMDLSKAPLVIVIIFIEMILSP